MPHHESTGHGGLSTIVLSDASGSSTVQIYLHGAQVNSWTINGKEQLFMSTAAIYDGVKPMRGGIPIVFPQFNMNGPLPQHGFARNSIWKWLGETTEGNAVVGSLELVDNEATRALWNHAFRLVLTVSVSSTALSVRLSVKNTGAASFNFCALMHTYLRVQDINTTSITGLKGFTFIDKMVNSEKFSEERDAVTFDRETDRIYENTGDNTVVLLDGTDRRVSVSSQGFLDCVVFNPWIVKARNLVDMNDDGYNHMVCIEPGSVVKEQTLEAGAEWIASERLVLIA